MTFSFQINNTRLQSVVLFFAAFLLYVNTLGHGFVLDDRALITENKWTQEGLAGIPQLVSHDSYAGFLANTDATTILTGGRYRPLTAVFFATLVQFFGNNSLVFHFFTVLLYALTCVLLHRFLLLAMGSGVQKENASMTAFIAAVLFAVHPVHTEVVANIKSCDEIIALLAGTGALYGILRAYDSGQTKWNIAAGMMFLLACLAKESAVTLLVLAPVTLWLFRNAAPLDALRRSWPLAAAFALYFVARGMALDWQFAGQMMNDPLNNPFLKASDQQWAPFTATEKAATILYTLLQYLRLLVWSWPLTHDYYPFQIEAMAFSQPWVLVSVALQLLLLGLACWGLYRRKTAAFGLLFYAVTLSIAANIFFPVGVFMAERFLFMPSLGFCLAIAALAALLLRSGKLLRIAGIAGLAALAVTWSVLTVMRTPAWKNEEQLFQTDVITSPKSAKLHNLLGTTLLSKALKESNPSERLVLLQEAETHLRTAVDLHPTFFDAFLAYGACVFYLQKYDLSIQAYRGATRIHPQEPKAKLGLAYALRFGGDYQAKVVKDPAKAIQYLSEAWQISPDTAIATHIANQYLELGQRQDAVVWLDNALSLAPDDPRLQESRNRAGNNAPPKATQQEQPFSSFRPAKGGN